MPIYEFHCEKCDSDSEILVRSSKWKGAKCPHCGSTKLEKKLSVFASSGSAGETADACSLSPTGKRGGCGCCCGGGGRHRH
jgi:putative FmdB family regulatory protein